MNVYCVGAPGWRSPIMRLTHRFVTLTSIVLAPGFAAAVMSTRNGFFQTTPRAVPFTETSARFCTSPRSSHRPRSRREPAGLRLRSSSCRSPCPRSTSRRSRRACSTMRVESRVTRSGAPRPGWNRTSHASLDGRQRLFGRGRQRPGRARPRACGSTTNTAPHGSRCSGTVVRPFAIRNDAGSRRPVSACQSSASLPLTRNVASTSSSRSLRLFTK